ncbi:MAG: bifunctional phosphopantothenoylcysteine decarboxylase/phosphopantothenate--cysteine ligase CoaBC [Candidatus Neomarinimicrobiota bacterium]
MAREKILFKITGSIAAYKSATVISRLVRAGYEVQTIVSSAALNFIGAATLEGLTGRPVYHDQFAPGTMMSHINLVKWADLTIVAPATANTINKLAAGNGESLLQALFLAHDRSKPYLLAPAMNTNMYFHPATQKALQTLAAWGVTILPTASGRLACGDEGPGKMLEPEDLLAAIWDNLNHSRSDRPQILITAGGTREGIDAVRYLGNISSGRTGAALADVFTAAGADVHFLHGVQSQLPVLPCFREQFSDTTDLEQRLQTKLQDPALTAVIHLAAVSDYRPVRLQADGTSSALPDQNKLASRATEITLDCRRTDKLVDTIKAQAANKNIRLAAFKLLSGATAAERQEQVRGLQSRCSADLVVANDMNDRTGDRQGGYLIFAGKELRPAGTAADAAALGQILVDLILKPNGSAEQ